jgi:heme-degrading monooxygenase HmoA
MFAVINRLKSPPDYGVHLERAFRHAGNMQDIPGFVGYQFMRNTRELKPGDILEYVALTYWDSREAYVAWTKTEAFSRAHQRTENSPVTAAVDTYDVLE